MYTWNERVRNGSVVAILCFGVLLAIPLAHWALSSAGVLPGAPNFMLIGAGVGGVLVGAYWLAYSRNTDRAQPGAPTWVLAIAMLLLCPSVLAIGGAMLQGALTS